jgi:hypothetical protein
MKKQLGRPKQSEESKEILHLSINRSIIRKLKIYCDVNNKSMTEVVSSLLNKLSLTNEQILEITKDIDFQ